MLAMYGFVAVLIQSMFGSNASGAALISCLVAEGLGGGFALALVAASGVTGELLLS